MKIETKNTIEKEKKGQGISPQKKVKPFKPTFDEITQLSLGMPMKLSAPSEVSSDLSCMKNHAIKDTEGSDTSILSMPLSSPYLYPVTSNVVGETEKGSLPQEISFLMDKLGAEMIILHHEGITETTVHLDDENLSPLLKNCTVTIVEYSSAPKIYNIKISAPYQSLSLIQSHVQQFLSLFQERKFGFSINRIDMELSGPEQPASFIEKTGDDDADKKQGGQR